MEDGRYDSQGGSGKSEPRKEGRSEVEREKEIQNGGRTRCKGGKEGK